jgi:DNA-binding phage protein
MVTGECRDITTAADKAGMSRESLSRALNKPHVAELLRQKVQRHLALHGVNLDWLLEGKGRIFLDASH